MCKTFGTNLFSIFFNLTQTRSHFAKNVSADIKNMHSKYTVTEVVVSDSPHKIKSSTATCACRGEPKGLK